MDNRKAKKERKMSWSVSANGTPAEVSDQLSEQFKQPLAEAPAGLSDAGERQTVQQVSDLLEQIVTTFDPETRVVVTANGHMGFNDWTGRTGPYQSVTLTVTPITPITPVVTVP
jgi:hypothetical protein